MPRTIGLYPDQMQRIAQICTVLNGLDGVDAPETDGVTLQFKMPLTLIDEHGDVYGEFRDEVGGAWCFYPAVNE